MRNPDRIPEIMSLLQEGWEKVPDWRFGQLMENLKRDIGVFDLFFIEDDELKKKIIDYFDLDEEQQCKSVNTQMIWDYLMKNMEPILYQMMIQEQNLCGGNEIGLQFKEVKTYEEVGGKLFKLSQ